MQRGDVAVPEEDFGILAQQIVVDPVQQLRRSVTAPDREHGVDRAVGEHGVQVLQALVDRAAQISVPLAYVLAELRLELEVLQRTLRQRQTIRIGDVG